MNNGSCKSPLWPSAKASHLQKLMNSTTVTHWFALLILHCNYALWLAERAPPLFSHSGEFSVYARPRFHFKMADIMMKIQQDKMALIFLTVDAFGSLNIQIELVLSRKSAGVFSFTFGYIVQKLSAKTHWRIVKTTLLLFYTFVDLFHQ